MILPEWIKKTKKTKKTTIGSGTSGGFKWWPGVAWPPHFKSTFTLNSSTTGINSLY